MGYVYIAATLLLTVLGQLLLKWQVNTFEPFPSDWPGRLQYLFNAYTNIWVISALACAFLASVTWMLALTQFELSYAYPFMSLAFLIVVVLGIMMFGEALTMYKIIGMTLVIAGLIIASQGAK